MHIYREALQIADECDELLIHDSAGGIRDVISSGCTGSEILTFLQLELEKVKKNECAPQALRNKVIILMKMIDRLL